MKNGKVTMQDVADALGISKNSVSRALTGKQGVSNKTERIIKQKAEELGYKYPRNIGIKNQSASNIKNIALIASDYVFSLKSFFGEIYLSIEKELKARDINFFTESINREAIENFEMPAVLKNHDIDGLLILSHINTDYTQKVIDLGIPTVLIDHHEPLLESDSVLTNNRLGAYEAVEHLINLGHKEIGFIGNVEFSPSYRERLEGYELALKRFSIKVKKEFLYTDASEKIENLQSFINGLDNLPTAFFCANDSLGFLTTYAMQLRSLLVPDDVSVISFDNGHLSQVAVPKISAVDIDLNYFGKKAVEQLCWRISNPNEPIQEILLPTKVIVRESTGMNLIKELKV
ncbi:LacI family DNA-binding transcriptional regulator [Neobacillus sp. PS3-34]|uniref:LacI family DNA-binding transcriptional regulator n=1 Tax=Neobacillus sp. PS3-34 TaxID=3070678 RepID=UPI0027E1F408|nr:LacI family DNA-binding transcriptional regulator [Neobacillus sp. PS3-34]WML49139.1 LacI family DNA-binding transcriptional regulator [Neobacillus sp. PS3-34]